MRLPGWGSAWNTMPWSTWSRKLVSRAAASRWGGTPLAARAPGASMARPGASSITSNRSVQQLVEDQGYPDDVVGRVVVGDGAAQPVAHGGLAEVVELVVHAGDQLLGQSADPEGPGRRPPGARRSGPPAAARWHPGGAGRRGPGRWILTTTDSPVMSVARWAWPIDADGQRFEARTRRTPPRPGRPSSCSTSGRTCSAGYGPDRRAQMGELLDHRLGQQVAPGRGDLAELHEHPADVLQGQPEPVAELGGGRCPRTTGTGVGPARGGGRHEAPPTTARAGPACGGASARGGATTAWTGGSGPGARDRPHGLGDDQQHHGGQHPEQRGQRVDHVAVVAGRAPRPGHRPAPISVPDQGGGHRPPAADRDARPAGCSPGPAR